MNQTLNCNVYPQRPDAVLLDLDGTLLDTVPIILQSFRTACKEITGIDLADEEMTPLLGMNDVDTRSHFVTKFNDERFPYELIRYRQGFIQTELFAASIQIKAGGEEILQVLKREDIVFGIHTGGSRLETELKLRSSGLAREVRSYVTGDQVSHGKPSPQILLMLKELLKEAEASQIKRQLNHCLVVGDGINDIRAGRNASMKTAYIPDRGREEEVVSLSDHVFTSLNELSQRLL